MILSGGPFHGTEIPEPNSAFVIMTVAIDSPVPVQPLTEDTVFARVNEDGYWEMEPTVAMNFRNAQYVDGKFDRWLD
jgi:hypothetical protein